MEYRLGAATTWTEGTPRQAIVFTSSPTQLRKTKKKEVVGRGARGKQELFWGVGGGGGELDHVFNLGVDPGTGIQLVMALVMVSAQPSQGRWREPLSCIRHGTRVSVGRPGLLQCYRDGYRFPLSIDRQADFSTLTFE